MIKLEFINQTDKIQFYYSDTLELTVYIENLADANLSTLFELNTSETVEVERFIAAEGKA